MEQRDKRGSVASRRREYPTWKDVINLERKDNKQTVQLKLKDNDRIIPRTIGKAKIPLNEVMSEGKTDQWYFLYKRTTVVGKIRVITEFEQKKVVVPTIMVIDQVSENSEIQKV